MKWASTFAMAMALSFTAAGLPARAQSDPYPGQPPQEGGQGGYGGYGGAGGGRRDLRDMTLQQFQARQIDNLMQADADHDGRISLAEWTTWRDAHPGRGGRGGDGRGGGWGDPAQSFARYDLNHDGYITPDEIATVAAARYARLQGGAPGMAPHGASPAPPPPPPQ